MRATSCILALAAPLAALAAPTRLITNRQTSSADLLVLTFADVLEQLESNFYSQGLAQFQESDFTAAGFTSATLAIQQLTTIQSDEATHDTTLQSAIRSLGAQPLTTCQFNFAPALTSVATMAATARIVEYVGVAAYLGAAPLITDPVLLGAAGSILTVEARHQTVLNILSGTGNAVAQPFDTALTPREVLAIASPFITGDCDLGVTPANTLTITNTGSVGPGTQLAFSSSALNSTTDTSGFFCQMMVGGAPFAIVLPFDQCIVPTGISGGVFIWITSDNDPLANNVIDRNIITQVAGPAVAMIDVNPDMLSQLVTTDSSVNSGESITTETISPGEASSIIAGATATTAAGAQVTASAGDDSSSSGISLSATPILSTGPSQDGHIDINGWTNLPTSD